MREYLNYFQSLITYEPKPEPWFDFWAREKDKLQRMVSEALFEEFKVFPMLAVLSVLKDHGQLLPAHEDAAQIYSRKGLAIVPQGWLTKRISSEELDEFINFNGTIGGVPVDNSHFKLEWERRRARLRGPFEIWRFHGGGGMMERAGYAFVRDELVLDSMLVLMS